MMFTICPVNEIKLLAVYSFFAVALLTGPATGLAVSWSRGWVQKTKRRGNWLRRGGVGGGGAGPYG